MRIRIVMLMVAALAVTAMPASAELPPGKWWQNPGVAERLGLDNEQQSQLDAIFRQSANELIDARAEIGKLSIAVRSELDRPQLNRQNLQRVAAQLSEARGRLFERELMLLVDMRGVLREDQWAKLRSQIDKRREQGPGQPRPMQKRRP